MQHVSAFSRPQTVPAVPASVPKRNLWILNSWRDLILYVGTPLLLVPMFALAQARWSAQDIYVFVAAFGAMGHHLPGMMQTYGFCRIYDAKMGSFAALTRRLDFASCAIWFAAAVLLSSKRMTDTLEIYYASGAPYIAPWLLHGVQQGVLFVAI